MGIAYRIDKDLGCTVVVWDGLVTPEDQTEHLLRLAADSDWPPGRLHLTDLTSAAHITLPDPDLVDALVEGTDFRNGVTKVLVVRPEFLRDTHLQEIVASPGGMPTAFSDLVAACAHLNVPAPTIRAVTDELHQEFDRARTERHLSDS